MKISCGKVLFSCLAGVPVLLSAGVSDGHERARRALEGRDYTTAVQILEKALQEEEGTGSILFQLAVAYCKAQETEKGIKTFLEALAATREPQKTPFYAEDEAFLKQILQKGGSGLPASEVARETLSQYLPIAEAHPDYYLLNFALALAHANLNQYAEFFSRFYTSFLHYPDHFLVDKTIGILHVKLAERAKLPEERSLQKGLAIDAFDRAIEKNPTDGHLYLLLIGMTRGHAELRALTVRTLERLVNTDVVIPRRDIVPYVHEALECGRVDLAERIIVQAKAHYPYSRALEAAENHVRQHAAASER